MVEEMPRRTVKKILGRTPLVNLHNLKSKCIVLFPLPMTVKIEKY